MFSIASTFPSNDQRATNVTRQSSELRTLLESFILFSLSPMKTLLVIATFLAVLAAPAHARVGETVKQVEARYGKPQRVLHERGFMVGVSYVAGVSKSEGFARPGIAKLSDADVQKLLALSLPADATWKPLPDQNGDSFWIRSGGKVVAFLNAHKFLQVQEKDFHPPK